VSARFTLPGRITVIVRPWAETQQQEWDTYMTEETAGSAPDPQRLRALERANEIRLARAGLKRRIAYGEVSAAEVLLACPREASSWPVSELLMSQRRWGSTRCRKFLSRNQILETKPIGKLTERQRRLLAEALQERVEPALHTVESTPSHEAVLAFA
jgi:hypothetical protein